MNKTYFIRDTILQKLKNEKNFDGVVVAEVNGNYFSVADIALPNIDGNCEVYRIAIVLHNQKKSTT